MKVTDRGTYKFPTQEQVMQMYVLPKSEDQPIKWCLSVVSDRGNISFRCSEIRKLRKIIVHLSLIYFIMTKPTGLNNAITLFESMQREAKINLPVTVW